MKNFEPFMDNQKIPDSFDKRINESVKKAKRGSLIYRNKKYIALSIVIMLFVGVMNPGIRAMAGDLPVIGELMSWFKSEKGDKIAKENGYPLGEKILTKDGYKLFMKDIYMDEESFSMKVSVEDENGKSRKIKKVKVSSSNYGLKFEHNARLNSGNINPWETVYAWRNESTEKENTIATSEENDMRINIKLENTDIEFNAIKFSKNELGKGKVKVIPIEKKTDEGIHIYSIKAYPNRTEITASDTIFDGDEVVCKKIILTDLKGKQYDFYKKLPGTDEVNTFVNKDTIYFEKDLELEKMNIVAYESKLFEEVRTSKSELRKEKNSTKEIRIGKHVFKVGIRGNEIFVSRDDGENFSCKIMSEGKWEDMYMNEPWAKNYIEVSQPEVETAMGEKLERILVMDKHDFKIYADKYIDYILKRTEEKSLRERDYDLLRKKMNLISEYGFISHYEHLGFEKVFNMYNISEEIELSIVGEREQIQRVIVLN